MNQYLIIGGRTGIGKKLTETLVNKGHQVYNVSRNIEQNFNTQVIQRSDILSDEIDWSFLPDHLDGLVYCPGSITLKPFRSIKPNQFINDFELNVIGAVNAIKNNINRLKRSEQGGSIVLFSTIAVQQGMPFHSSVSAAKGAVEGLTRSLAAEFAPNIRVNAIAPSLVDTPLAEKLMNSDSKKENAAARHPLKRYGRPEDIAGMAEFLLSPESSWMTGQIIHVDGGLSTVRV